MNPTNSELADKLEHLLKWNRWDDARLGHWIRDAGDRILAALRTRKSEALADDAVKQVLAHVADGGPHEWGYRDPVTGDFIADDWPFRAAGALAALSPAIDLLRDIREAVTLAREALDDSDETEAHVLLSNVQERIDAELKEAAKALSTLSPAVDPLREAREQLNDVSGLTGNLEWRATLGDLVDRIDAALKETK